jgi:hypothetical protein
MFANDKRAPSGLERVYIPTALGNSEDEKPLTVRIAIPTERQRRNFFASSSHDQLKTVGAHWEAKYAAIKECLLGIENYWRYDSDGKDVAIATAEDFIEHGQSEFIAEVGDEIITSFSLVSEEVADAKK